MLLLKVFKQIFLKIFSLFIPVFFPVFLIVLLSCDRNNNSVDLSDVPVDSIKISRYEIPLFTANPYELYTDLQSYTDEFSFFLGEEFNTVEGQDKLFDFVTDTFLQDLFYDVMEEYPDLNFLEDQLTQSFRYHRYYYPEETNPKVYSYISGLDYMMPVKYADHNVIIGLDMYLGRDNVNYERAAIPKFKRKLFSREYIATDVMKIMAEKNIPDDLPPPESLLDFMVYEGRILYFLDLMLPEVPDSVKIGYTNNQITWMEGNAKFVWSYFIDNELIFSQDRQMINKFVGDTPFTTVFSPNSAPRVGAWLGWQIVKGYMSNESDVTIKQLLEEKEPREIFHKSAFKPR